MEGSKGICNIYNDGNLVIKTQFDTKENCQKRIDILIKIGVFPENTKPYKCKECGFWHLGKPDHVKKYSI
jgi:hypothetical protein